MDGSLTFLSHNWIAGSEQRSGAHARAPPDLVSCGKWAEIDFLCAKGRIIHILFCDWFWTIIAKDIYLIKSMQNARPIVEFRWVSVDPFMGQRYLLVWACPRLQYRALTVWIVGEGLRGDEVEKDRLGGRIAVRVGSSHRHSLIS